MASQSPAANSPEICRILSLDGGGAKGFYTLGVLKELEALVGKPLYQQFDLIFGTSTGAIIAALLALGRSVDEIHALYKKHVPAVMQKRTAGGRSAALSHLARTVFGETKFTDVKTGIGIVATRWAFEKPMIFSNSSGPYWRLGIRQGAAWRERWADIALARYCSGLRWCSRQV